jgi:signal transduction histidine kinase
MKMARIAVSARVFGLAAALGLAASGRTVPQVAGSFLLLCAIAALASVPQPTEAGRRTAPIIEGALVGLTLSIAGFVDQPLLLYLIIPMLVAGLVGGTAIVATTLFVEVGVMASVAIVRLQADVFPMTLRLVLPWLMTATGIGLLGSWIRRLRSTPTDDDRAGYVEAHRLLHELRSVSRRLSSGLDPVVLATTLLEDCLGRVTSGRGAILVRNGSGRLVPLARSADDGQWDAATDPTILRCWTTSETAHTALHGRLAYVRPSTTDEPRRSSLGRTRWALPLRVGTDTVGVLAVDTEQSLGADQLAGLRLLLDQRALPLDTAMLFDEVRTHATVEERHRLAREIHDGVAQEIASLAYLVDDLVVAPDAARVDRVAHLRRELTRIVDDLRLSIFDLRSEVTRTSSLGSVLADYLLEVGSRSGTAVVLNLDESPDRLRLEVEEQLLRIAQEAVTNARKHSGAAHLWVTCVVRPPGAYLVVEDDGSGVRDAGRSNSFGVRIMRERAGRIGATLDVAERTGGGTRVSVRLHARPDAIPEAVRESASAQPRLEPALHTAGIRAHG